MIFSTIVRHTTFSAKAMGRSVRWHSAIVLAFTCAVASMPLGAAELTPSPASEGRVLYPQPITLDPDQPGKVDDFILSAPGVTTVIIANRTDGRKYVFPFWGGDQILQRYVTTITGQSLPIITPEQYEASDKYKGNDVYRIWMGRSPKQVNENIGNVLDKIDDDGFVIKAIAGRDLYIAGKHDWGTHFAPYDLLERAADCRWYLEEPRFWMPKEDGVLGVGDLVPQKERVTIPGNTLIIEEPSYRSRWFRMVPRHSYRVQIRDRFHHALVNIFPPATLGKTHPELFPLINGKRYVPTASRLYDSQPCISNPMTVDIVVDKATKDFEAGLSTFSVGMNDTNKYCECDNCTSMAPTSIQGKNERIAYAYAMWYNQIAERLSVKYPDKRLGMLAYAVLSALPSDTIKLHPMIVPYLTRDSAQLFDKSEQVEFRETIDRWSKIATRMGIYEYTYGGGDFPGGGFYIPRLYNRYILKNILEQYGVSADGFYAEAYPNWSLDGHKNWFTAKLLWNKNLDIPTLEADFYNHMFGQAASQMKDYFDFLEETWCTQTLPSKRSNYRWLNDPTQLAIFSPDKCDQALALLEKARQAATTDEASKRIAFYAQGFEVTNQLARRYDAGQKIKAIAEAEGEIDQNALLAQLAIFQALPDADTLNELRLKAGLGTEKSTDNFIRNWCQSEAYTLAVNALLENLAADVHRSWRGGSMADMHKAADAVIAKLPLNDKPKLKADLSDLLKNRNLLFVRSMRTAPAADTGKINPAQWGKPVFEGHFYQVFSSLLSTQKTTIYAVAVDGQPKNLYLAMDCQGDPSAMGADVTDIAQDSAYPRKMRFDDAVALNRRYVGQRYMQHRVNILGVQQSLPQNHFKAAVSRNDQGWQTTMVLSDGLYGKQNLNPPANLAISRYERLPAVDPKSKDKNLSHPQSQTTTLVPTAKFGSVVGSGNHDHLMSFLWGPVLIYEKPAPNQNEN